MTRAGFVGVLCVEDNLQVAEALRIQFESEPGYAWKGWLPDADHMVETAEAVGPAIVVLDLDMPGRSPFHALAELSRLCPNCRAVILSGHVRRDLIDRALQAGAWGYVSKNDDDRAVFRVIERVLNGEIAFSPEVDRAYNHSA